MESQYNNVDTSLDIGQTWSGEAEVCNGYIIILVDIKSTEACTIKVHQSDNKSNYNFEKTIEYLPLTGAARYQIYRNSVYCYVEVINTSGNPIPNLIIRTHFLNIGRDPTIFDPMIVAGAVEVLNFPATQAVSGTVGVNNFPATQAVSGTVGVNNFPATQAVSGSVGVNNFPATSTGDLIINGTGGSATRPIYLMNIATWYRVASIGNTPGHVWNSIGAIVGSENLPTVGRLFKCLSVPSNIEGQGMVYDVEYNDVVTATPVGIQDVNIVSTVTIPVSGSVALLPAVDPALTLGTVRLNDAYGNPLVTTAGNLMVGINNIYTTNPLHTIVDSGSVSLSDTLNTTTYNQAVSGVSFTGTAYDMGQNSLVDVLLLATGTIGNGSVRLDYSIDGTTWFPNNSTTYTITSTDPHQTVIGLKTGSRYIRVSTGGGSSFLAGNLQMTFSSKRN